MRRVGLALAVIALLGSSGCSMLMQMEGGVAAHAGSHHPPTGAAFDLHGGIGVADSSSVGFGFGASMHYKAGQDFYQVYLAPHAYVLAGDKSSPVRGYGRLGLGLIQVEHWGDRTPWGALSPIGSVGILIPFHEELSVTVSTSAEYDLRFTSGVPSTPAFTLNVGIGAGVIEKW
jgi:hypothetical protein